MRDELGVFPHEMTSSSVLLTGDRLYVTTSNGVDWTNKHIPSPTAPGISLPGQEKPASFWGRIRAASAVGPITATGRALRSEISAESRRSPSGGGDGFCYGFDPDPVEGTLKELWRVDCNPAEHKVKAGKTLKYGDPNGPSEILGTPVIVDGRVYVTVGQDPEHGDGPGCLTCIDATDPAHAVAAWRNTSVGRSMSTAAVADGLVYVPDSSGKLFCVDVPTGKTVWSHDLESHVWGSTLVADGKLYIGNENGELTILTAGRETKEVGKIDFGQPVYSTAVAANGVLYVSTGQNLFALKQ